MGRVEGNLEGSQTIMCARPPHQPVVAEFEDLGGLATGGALIAQNDAIDSRVPYQADPYPCAGGPQPARSRVPAALRSLSILCVFTTIDGLGGGAYASWRRSHLSAASTEANTLTGRERLTATVSANCIKSPFAFTST